MMDDDDLVSFFDESDVLVSPSSPPVSSEPIIDLTKTTSFSESSEAARMSTIERDSEKERYKDSQLISDIIDDDVVVKSDEKGDKKRVAKVDRMIDQDVEEAAMTPEENVPDVEIIDALMKGEDDIHPDEMLMDPSDRHKAIVSSRLDELTPGAAGKMDDEITVGSESGRPRSDNENR